MQRTTRAAVLTLLVTTGACATSVEDEAAPTTRVSTPVEVATTAVAPEDGANAEPVPPPSTTGRPTSPTTTMASTERGVPAGGTNAQQPTTTALADDVPNTEPAQTAPAKPTDTAPPVTPASTQPPQTQPPSAEAPTATAAPSTAPPATATPSTSPPPTEPPATAPPATAPPATQPPTTQPPETQPAETQPAETQPPQVSASSSSEAVRLTNEQRAAAGLAPLTANGTLASAASTHSADQARTGQMSHTGSDGSNVGARIAAAGGSFSTWGENVAFGYGSAAGVVDGWMNSAGHRDNILNPAFTQIGVASAAAPDGTLYWTMVLAG